MWKAKDWFSFIKGRKQPLPAFIHSLGWKKRTGAVPHGQNSTSCQRIHASSLFTEPWHCSYMAAASRIAFCLVGDYLVTHWFILDATLHWCCRPAHQLLNITLGGFMLNKFPFKEDRRLCIAPTRRAGSIYVDISSIDSEASFGNGSIPARWLRYICCSFLLQGKVFIF